MTADSFCETTSSIARQAAVLPETVRAYADLGLVECMRLPNGVRLFKPSAAEQVKSIYVQRMANRGRARSAAAA